MTLENLSTNKSFSGWHKQYRHPSESLNCDMRFAIFLPLKPAKSHPFQCFTGCPA